MGLGSLAANVRIAAAYLQPYLKQLKPRSRKPIVGCLYGKIKFKL